jgi:hypothetical protein
MNNALVGKQDHQHAPDVQSDLPHCVCTWKGWIFSLRGLLFVFWVITVTLVFFSCVSDAVFPSLKENLKQRHCFFKSAFRKSWFPLNMHSSEHTLRSNAEGYGCRIPCTDSQDSDTTVCSGRNLCYLPFLILVMSSGTSTYLWCEWIIPGFPYEVCAHGEKAVQCWAYNMTRCVLCDMKWGRRKLCIRHIIQYSKIR